MAHEPTATLARTALVERLERAPMGSVVVLEAPHGYGKTTLLGLWGRGGTIGTSQLRLTAAHRDPRALASDLARVLNLPEADDADAWLRGVLRSGSTGMVALVLDNVHTVADSPSVALLELLVKATPRWMILVLSGRAIPVGTTRAKLERRLTYLGIDDLALSLEEIPESWRDSALVAEVLDLSGGWPLSLRLASLPEVKASGMAERREKLLELFGDYLEEEVFPSEDAAVLLALEEIAEIGSDSLDIVSAVRGLPEPGAAGGLVQTSLPMVRVDRGRGEVRLSRAMARHLSARLWRRDPDRALQLRLNASKVLEKRGEYDSSYSLLMTLGLRQEMARFVLRNMQRQVMAGKTDAAASWLAEFTDEELEEYPELVMAQALMEGAEGRLESMNRLIEVKESLPVPSGAEGMVQPGVSAWGLLREFTGMGSSLSLRRAGAAAKGWWGLVGLMNDGLHASAEGRLDEARASFEAVQRLCKGYPLVDLWSTSGRAWLIWHEGRRDDFVTTVLEKRDKWNNTGLWGNVTAFSYESVLALALAITGATSEARTHVRGSRTKQHRMGLSYPPARLINAMTLAYTAIELGDDVMLAEQVAECRQLAPKVPEAVYLHRLFEELQRRAPDPVTPELGLTASELKILKYLPTQLTMPEVGRELNLSPATVRTHTHSIFRKLGVHNRTEAVRAAQRAGLLPST